MVADNEGNTPLHVAAAKGFLRQLPHSVIKPHLFTMENEQGLTAALVAIINGHFQQFPRDLQPAILNQPDQLGNTALHLAVAAGRLDKIPPALLTEEYLGVRNDAGQTVFHAAACFGHQNQLPASMLTESNLLLTDKCGLTATDMAVAQGHADQVPLPFGELQPHRAN
jgi:ankyrin repeat protein